MSDRAVPAARAGRRPATSRAELEHLAFELFERDGFEHTTVDDIAAAAGIGRRTFFRYFASKNDIPWGDFDDRLDLMRAGLAEHPPSTPLMDAVRETLLDFNRVDPAEQHWHRRRMRLILEVPALQAHSTLRYAHWRQVLAGFVAHRLAQPPDALAPQAISYATLGVALAAYERWLRDDGTDLADLLDTAMRELAAGFGVAVTGPVTG